mmetsp:Transcript_7902/g.26235  ORF Transcript_7902/g.26235 Transcript_7902/m.26235 type:complete len:190 (-) Transcript_7902:102-671(-)
MSEGQTGGGVADELVDELAQGPERLGGYAWRLGALLKKARLVAYTSDVGEAARPIVSPHLVKAAYGVSGLYVVADVGATTYQAKERGESDAAVARTCAHQTIFQVLASLLLPAVTIHQTVHVAEGIIKRSATAPAVMRRWGAPLTGLCVIPLLPILLDHPVETVVDYAFDTAWPKEEVKEPPAPETAKH